MALEKAGSTILSAILGSENHNCDNIIVSSTAHHRRTNQLECETPRVPSVARLRQGTENADRSLKSPAEPITNSSTRKSIGAKDEQMMEDALLDCYGRFITLLPEKLLKDHVHLYFQIQEAYWWYEDIWQEVNPDKLPKLTLKDFGYMICNDCPVLKRYVAPHEHGKFLQNWRRYCRTIPLRGAIILNHNLCKCLVVHGWGGGPWMFPRGKVDEMEEDVVCACREIWEEVGVDVSAYIDEQVYIETYIEEQPIKLFVVPGIREDVQFEPKKRKEIGQIMWMEVTNLPGWLTSNTARRLRTWQIRPFVHCLRGWIDLLRQGTRQSPLPIHSQIPRRLYGGLVRSDQGGERDMHFNSVGISNLNSYSSTMNDAKLTHGNAGIAAYIYQLPDVPLGVIQRLQNAVWNLSSIKEISVDSGSKHGSMHNLPANGTSGYFHPSVRKILSGWNSDGCGDPAIADDFFSEKADVSLALTTPPPASFTFRSYYKPSDIDSTTRRSHDGSHGVNTFGSRGLQASAMRLRETGQTSFDDQEVDKRLAIQRRALGIQLHDDGKPEMQEQLDFSSPRGKFCSKNNESVATKRNHSRLPFRVRRHHGTREGLYAFDDSCVSYHLANKRTIKRQEKSEVPATIGESRQPRRKSSNGGQMVKNTSTFGPDHCIGWSPEEMFRLNAELYGVQSTFDMEHYTVPLTCGSLNKQRQRTTSETEQRRGSTCSRLARDINLHDVTKSGGSDLLDLLKQTPQLGYNLTSLFTRPNDSRDRSKQGVMNTDPANSKHPQTSKDVISGRREVHSTQEQQRRTPSFGGSVPPSEKHRNMNNHLLLATNDRIIQQNMVLSDERRLDNIRSTSASPRSVPTPPIQTRVLTEGTRRQGRITSGTCISRIDDNKNASQNFEDSFRAMGYNVCTRVSDFDKLDASSISLLQMGKSTSFTNHDSPDMVTILKSFLYTYDPWHNRESGLDM